MKEKLILEALAVAGATIEREEKTPIAKHGKVPTILGFRAGRHSTFAKLPHGRSETWKLLTYNDYGFPAAISDIRSASVLHSDCDEFYFLDVCPGRWDLMIRARITWTKDGSWHRLHVVRSWRQNGDQTSVYDLPLWGECVTNDKTAASIFYDVAFSQGDAKGNAWKVFLDYIQDIDHSFVLDDHPL